MVKTKKRFNLETEIDRMMDIYEIYELSEESGLQDEFKEDIIKIYKEGYNKARQEIAFLKEKLAKERENILKEIDKICETEGWTNHNNPEHVITTNRLKRIFEQRLKGEK